MMRRMEKGKLLRRKVEVDAYNEQIVSWIEEREPIEVAISVATGAMEVMNEVLSVRATHTALTKDKRPCEGDKITIGGQTYLITYVIPTRRMNQLMLSTDESIEK